MMADNDKEQIAIERKQRDKATEWKTGEEVFRWWMEEEFPNQIGLFDEF